MTDRDLIAELRDAVQRPHVKMSPGDREFVRRLQDREHLTEDDRERAERIFAERVDW